MKWFSQTAQYSGDGRPSAFPCSFFIVSVAVKTASLFRAVGFSCCGRRGVDRRFLVPPSFSHRRGRGKSWTPLWFTSRALSPLPPWENTVAKIQSGGGKTSRLSCRTFTNKFPGTGILISACFTNHLNLWRLPRTCTSTCPRVSTSLFSHVFIFCRSRGELCSSRS